jgi:hypothetical protein
MRSQTLCCASTISLGFEGPTHNITFVGVEPIDTSYETICAADRNAPGKAYFELLARPEIGTP